MQVHIISTPSELEHVYYCELGSVLDCVYPTGRLKGRNCTVHVLRGTCSYQEKRQHPGMKYQALRHWTYIKNRLFCVFADK